MASLSSLVNFREGWDEESDELNSSFIIIYSID